eukprot:scaffold301_cov243-Pinguiococcus_pyrenoidosus.AAC.147
MVGFWSAFPTTETIGGRSYQWRRAQLLLGEEGFALLSNPGSGTSRIPPRTAAPPRRLEQQ